MWTLLNEISKLLKIMFWKNKKIIVCLRNKIKNFLIKKKNITKINKNNLIKKNKKAKIFKRILFFYLIQIKLILLKLII